MPAVPVTVLALAAVGQFALRWSLPRGAGLVAAGAPETVAVSVPLAFGGTAAAPALGFGTRRPGTAADRRAREPVPGQ